MSMMMMMISKWLWQSS